MYKRVEMLIAACFYYSGLVKLTRWWKQRSGQSLVILNYHRATEGDLRRHLLYLRRYYRVLHLEAALEELYAPHKNGQRNAEQRTALVITFDDGYYDNYTHAFALARELQIPITIFLVPGYIENRRHFWWQEDTYLVTHTQMSKASIEGRIYHLDQEEGRKALTLAIDARVRYATSVTEREEFLVAVRAALAVPTTEAAEERSALPLTWREVQEMKESTWVSFGAHTMHHPILAYLTDSTEVQYEVSSCREVLERHLGHEVHTFAYPVGGPEHIGEHAIRAVQKAGYTWAVTTMYGFNSARTDPYLLRRIIVDVDQHWLSVAAKASGVWDFFTRLYRTPITLLRVWRTRSMPKVI